jgi:integrase
MAVAVVTFAYVTGWRASEINGLQWGQVDFGGRTGSSTAQTGHRFARFARRGTRRVARPPVPVGFRMTFGARLCGTSDARA